MLSKSVPKYRGYYMVARTYEVYLLMEKIFFIWVHLLHRYECFENKKKLDEKQKKNKEMMSAIFSQITEWM